MAELGYWSIRGLAEPARYLLHHVGAKFEDRRYDPGYNNVDDWYKVKHTLGLVMPNLPYFIDGEHRVTESNAILAYLGRKYKLAGKTETERILVDISTNAIMDLRNGFARLCYNPNYEELKPDYAKSLPVQLKKFAEFLNGKKFVAGDEVTYPDFHLFEMLDVHLEWDKSCLNEFPVLQAYHKRVAELSGVKAYRESNAFKRHPVNSPARSWWN